MSPYAVSRKLALVIIPSLAGLKMDFPPHLNIIFYLIVRTVGASPLILVQKKNKRPRRKTSYLPKITLSVLCG